MLFAQRGGPLGFQANLGYDLNMKSSTKKVIPKKRGRPATGKDPLVSTRMPPALIAAVEAWATQQSDDPGRSEAIRRLVEIGLTVPTMALPDERKEQQDRGDPKQRARELASKAIDKVADPVASPDDQANRKRRLIKGPEEFQKVRRDRNRK
ncbi:hypothetical protein [Bradyrhizobium sp. USDA 3240]